MNNVLIIYFELTFQVKSRVPLINRIKTLGAWAKLGNSAYLVMTQYNPVQVRDHLWEVMNKADKIYVGVCGAPSAWNNLPQDVSNWIRTNQKK